MMSGLGLIGGVGGGIIVSKLIDYLVPFGRTPQGKLFKEQKKWQQEVEEERMSFQERLETRRLRCQENIERQRGELQFGRVFVREGVAERRLKFRANRPREQVPQRRAQI